MPWLKYELCYAEGYAQPLYIELNPIDDLEELKHEITVTESDGLRAPRFTVLETLPRAVLTKKIEEAERERAAISERISRYRIQLSEQVRRLDVKR